MEKWYPILFNILIGIWMTAIGFRIYTPKFKSSEAKEKFYKKWSLFFKLGGFIMVVWGIYKMLNR